MNWEKKWVEGISVIHVLALVRTERSRIILLLSISSPRLSPFWARIESGIFRTVVRTGPNYDDLPWPSVSS
ncbi:unnamed protein product [Brassica rapa]|uniref:Uncharacterized protein n=2 Tax=Brassica TaxID=3705 RepID=A0A8D9DHS5_BRACM|nr:unnamed protein product [Brassica napus]CAG7873593.1 unnamed protein product [Brassica rapa]